MIELSIIIPTRNRCLLLQKALESLTKQTFSLERFEVIVIDNGSTDDTKAIAKSFDGQLKLQYHYDNRPGLHVGRHDGMKLSQSNLLAFADDDIEAFPTWLDGIYESFQDNKIVLVGGKNLPKYESQPPFWILEKWYQMYDYGHCVPELSILDFGDENKEIPASYVWGCNFAIRKDVLQAAGGFHPDGMPFDLIQYRGDGESYVSKFITENHLKTAYNPRASIYHIVPNSRMTIDYFKKRAFCQGVEMSYIDKRYAQEIKPQHINNFRKLKKYFNIITGITTRQLIKTQMKESEMTDIEKQINLSRQLGYNYHHQLYIQQEYLREWVHKNNYLEIDK